MKRLALLLLTVTALFSCTQQKPEAPNVILIFTDDQGYGDVGCFGAEGFETPNLDALAEGGTRFTDFLVAACVCTPSRAALLTGCYPARVKTTQVYFPWTEKGLAPEIPTIADVLKEQGYATACVGKWHLGHKTKYLPTKQGFDLYFGVPYSNDMAHDGSVPLAEDAIIGGGFTLADYTEYRGEVIRERYGEYVHNVPLMRQEEVIEWPVDQTQLTRRYAGEVVDFIKKHASDPFFIYLAHSMPHTPIFASDAFLGSSEKGLYGDVIQEIDWSVGQIRSALEELGLLENTLVIFTTDNGPWLIEGDHGGSAGPLRDGKGSTYEGGQRVPCIMSWPGTIPQGRVCDSFATSMDIMPTVASLAGASLPEDLVIDGKDITDMLLGKKGASSGHEFFLYDREEAIRMGHWKYRRGKERGMWSHSSREARRSDTLPNPVVIQLFNLEDDPGETINLAKQFPEKVSEMEKELQRRLVEITR